MNAMPTPAPTMSPKKQRSVRCRSQFPPFGKWDEEWRFVAVSSAPVGGHDGLRSSQRTRSQTQWTQEQEEAKMDGVRAMQFIRPPPLSTDVQASEATVRLSLRSLVYGDVICYSSRALISLQNRFKGGAK